MRAQPSYVARVARNAWDVSALRVRQQFQKHVDSCLPRKPYSLLSIYSHFSGWQRILFGASDWVLDQEAIEQQRIACRLGINARINYELNRNARQCYFLSSQFVFDPAHERYRQYLESRNRIAAYYLHGVPRKTPGHLRVFDDSYKQLQQHHPRIARILVSHSQMEQVILESGIEPPKVHRIPIGINLDYFDVQTPEARKAARRRLNIPDSAVVIGSFQKDGDGWGEGREPKLIKGPDVFLKVIERIKPRVPELFVLLSGPARGYVKAGLARLGVPFRHVYLMDYAEVGLLYQALDLYLVTSRVEGGPKAILESMASGVPLVTTKVGQAMDLVQHGQNAWMVEVEDAEGLAHWAEHALASRQTTAVNEVLRAGRATAEANSYDSQEKQWREFFRGFVETI